LAATYEALIPDVHDGDAPSALASDAGSDASDPADHSQRSPSQVPIGDGHGSQHPVHVDHCGHNHLGGTPLAVSALAVSLLHKANPIGRHLALVSISESPLLRPPIV
jgi:hypothetical protein